MAHPILGAEIDAVFGTDGRVAGSAGCNNYSAPYRLEESGIAIGPVAATRRFCAEPPGVMEQEARYLEALQSATILRRDAENMQLRTAQDSLAVYLKRAVGAAPPR
jgi:heat shock protein HslJ